MLDENVIWEDDTILSGISHWSKIYRPILLTESQNEYSLCLLKRPLQHMTENGMEILHW